MLCIWRNKVPKDTDAWLLLFQRKEDHFLCSPRPRLHPFVGAGCCLGSAGAVCGLPWAPSDAVEWFIEKVTGKQGWCWTEIATVQKIPRATKLLQGALSRFPNRKARGKRWWEGDPGLSSGKGAHCRPSSEAGALGLRAFRSRV